MGKVRLGCVKLLLKLNLINFSAFEDVLLQKKNPSESTVTRHESQQGEDLEVATKVGESDMRTSATCLTSCSSLAIRPGLSQLRTISSIRNAGSDDDGPFQSTGSNSNVFLLIPSSRVSCRHRSTARPFRRRGRSVSTGKSLTFYHYVAAGGSKSEADC